MIPPDFIQQLLARVDIVEVIDRHVKLKKSGQNYSACCPFHSEKSPSFSVSPIKQFYHCFGCGAHGTAISFLMEYNGLGFRDAVDELAQLVGLSLPVEANREESLEKARQSASLGEVMTAAMQFYRAQLKISPTAIDYLKGRGVSGAIAAKFALGYAPDDWQALKGAVQDYTSTSLKECGLIIDNDEGRRYDRFRDRVMFPILDPRGNVIGFGGRIIGEGEPKYLNSPETTFFVKGNELYGLFQARRAIRDTNTVIVVEGYMDVVALAQSGIDNAVATLGTATTPIHVEKLLRLADNLVFCFDGDKAGQRAAWRALEQSLPLIQDGKEVRFLFLPADDDPDTFVRRLGKDAFLEEQKNAAPLSQFLFDHLRAQVDTTNEEGRARLMTLAKPLIVEVGAPALAFMLRRKLAEETGLSAIEIERVVPLSPTLGKVSNAAKKSVPNQANQQNGQTKNFKPWRKKGEPEPGAPTPRNKPVAAGLAVQMIGRMLLRPSLANRFDISVAEDDESPLGSAFRVAAYIRDHDGEMVHQAMIVEHFRQSPDAYALQQASVLLSEVDTDRLDLETEFSEALDRLRLDAANLAKRAEENRRAREMGLI